MAIADLEILSNDALVDLGAQLETELANAKNRLATHVEQLEDRQKRLTKPGLKLAVNAAVGIAGVSLAPVTFGWSLLLTALGSAVTISDAIDFSGDVARIHAVRREIENLRRLLSEIVSELEDIDALLTRRLGVLP